MSAPGRQLAHQRRPRQAPWRARRAQRRLTPGIEREGEVTGPVGARRLSPKGLELIASFEGFRTRPYNDAAGHATIGYGHLIHHGPVTSADVARSGSISRQRGLELLRQDARVAERAVIAAVTRPLRQEQFDALVSFVFNVGGTRLRSSTLLRKLNAGDERGAADELLRWTRAGGRVLQGLARRRRAERKLFLSTATSPMPALTPAAPTSPPAALTPAEHPGGGRIRVKTDPAPADIVTVVGASGRRVPLHRLAARAWSALLSEARAAGIAAPLLLPTSGYRSSAHQKRLFERAKQRYGSAEVARRWVAPPGDSPHQSGRAVDFYLGGRNDSSNVASLRRLPAYRWLAANAQRFGFYPYEREPWHWEYNPAAAGAAPSPELEGTFGYEVGQDAAAPVDWCRMRQAIVAAALAEEPRWRGPNRTARHEYELVQRPILQEYWSAVPGFARPAAAKAAARLSALNLRDGEWSAAFICFVMRTAGVGPEHGFVLARRHLNYIVGALRNRERSDRDRPFWLVDQVELQREATPQKGDLLCFNRSGNGAVSRHSYRSLRRAFWEGGRETAPVTGISHCAIVVATGRDRRGPFLETIGGNEAVPGSRRGTSVLRRRIALSPTGQIANPAALGIFGMIKLVAC